MKEQIKQLRVEIDGLHQLTLGLKPVTIYGVGVVPSRHFGNHTTEIGFTEKQGNSKEIEQAAEKLIFAKAWLGKVLGELGEETPYKNDGDRKTKEDIEPTTDKAHLICGMTSPIMKGSHKISNSSDGFELGVSVPSSYISMTHVKKVDWLREEIKSIVQKLHNTVHYNEVGVSSGELSLTYLQEARFWLGFELQRIREE